MLIFCIKSVLILPKSSKNLMKYCICVDDRHKIYDGALICDHLSLIIRTQVQVNGKAMHTPGSEFSYQYVVDPQIGRIIAFCGRDPKAPVQGPFRLTNLSHPGLRGMRFGDHVRITCTAQIEADPLERIFISITKQAEPMFRDPHDPSYTYVLSNQIYAIGDQITPTTQRPRQTVPGATNGRVFRRAHFG